MALKGDPDLWSTTDRQGVIFRALSEQGDHVHVPGTREGKRKCPTCRAAARELFNRVGSEPLIYRSGGKPLPKGKARWERFMNNVGEIHAYVNARPWLDTPSEAPEPAPEPIEAPEPDPVESEPAPAPTPVEVPQTLSLAAERFYSEVQKRRAFVRGRKGMESLDSMRVVIDGLKAVMAGVPVEALVSAIEAPWTAETRAQCSVFRPSESDLKPKLPEGSYDYAEFAPRPSEFAHAVSAYVLALVKAGVPVWLHGPAGTGKSSAAHYAADALGLDYYEVNLAGAMVSAVKGKDRLKEFVESDAMKAYEHGGLLCLEEFDSAHPSVGTALNTMLAGDEYHNDADGRTIKRHPDFRCVVTANSLGYGSAEFKRNDLDGATKDRFRMGRVYTGLDLGLERSIFNAMLAAA